MSEFDDLERQVMAHLEGDTPDESDTLERLESIGTAIAKLRDEAIKGRKESGIEDIWAKCEESYLGIDDANRGEFKNAKWAKPMSAEGPLTRDRQSGEEIRSTVFVRLTSRYVDAGAAKMQEILLPIDDKPFSFEPTPVPDLIKGKEDLRPVTDEQGQPMMKPAEAAPPVPGAPPAPPAPPAQMTVKDLAEQVMAKATDSAKKAEKRIYDWMVEAKHPAEMRKVIHDASRIGVGVLKGPFPVIRSSKALTQTEQGVALEMVEEIKPGEKWIDAWNLFPDPACGEDIHEGGYVVEADYLARKQVIALKKDKTYITSQLDKVLEEGPGKANLEASSNPNKQKAPDKKRFPVWYFTGSIKRDELALLNPGQAKTVSADQEDVFAIVTMINDTAVKATINPLESGKFPYRAMPWSRRPGHWAGVGVGEQAEVPQRILNGATRAMLNNAGKSAGSQIVIGHGLEPVDGQPTITPDKLWQMSPEAVVDDVRKLFATFQIPNITPAMMEIIQYAFKLAEESTNIPLVTQGQSGPTTPNTLGQTQLQDNNANQLLRSVAASFDDHITEPLIDDYYEWLMLDPDVPEEEKGDFQINAHGSIVLVERAIQDQTLLWMSNVVMNPAFGLDPEKWITEMLKSKRMDPRTFSLSDEDKAKRQQQPPPMAPAVQAAQIRAQSDLQKTQMTLQADGQVAQMENTTEIQRIKTEADRDTIYANAERERTTQDIQVRMAELQIKKDLAVLEYATQQKISLDEVKAGLAKESMRLNVQKELAGAEQMLDLHKHHVPAAQQPIEQPPVQVPGRAPNGHAFQQV